MNVVMKQTLGIETDACSCKFLPLGDAVFPFFATLSLLIDITRILTDDN